MTDVTTATPQDRAAVGWSPIYMRNVDLILGDEASDGSNFKCQLRGVDLSPDVNITRTKTLCPTGQFSNVDDPEWTLELRYLYGVSEDNTNPSLSDYLLDNIGAQVPFTFRPVSGGKGYTGTVTLVPGPIGGDQGSFSEQSVSLPVEGQPVREGAGGAPSVVAAAGATPADADVTATGSV